LILRKLKHDKPGRQCRRLLCLKRRYFLFDRLASAPVFVAEGFEAMDALAPAIVYWQSTDYRLNNEIPGKKPRCVQSKGRGPQIA
jgi:hypothetical protein